MLLQAELMSGGFLSICGTQLALLLLSVVVIVPFGIARLVQVHRTKKVELERVSPLHVVVMLVSVAALLLPVGHSIYLLWLQFVVGEMLWHWTMHAQNILSFLTWTFATIIVGLEYSKGLRHGWVIATFWTVTSVYEGLTVQKLVSSSTNADGSLWFFICDLVVSIILAAISLLANKKPPLKKSQEELSDKRTAPADKTAPAEKKTTGSDSPKTSPEANANFFSYMTYWWLNPLLKKGYRTALYHDDLPPLRDDDDAKYVSEIFATKWKEEMERYKDKPYDHKDPKSDKPSLFKALFRAFGVKFIIGGVIKLGNDSMIFAGPIFLGLIVEFLNSPSQPFWVGMLYALGMFLGSLIQSLSIHKYFHFIYRVNMNIKASLIAAVYGKAMRLSHEERQESTVGEIVNLQSIDSLRVGETVTYLHTVWSAPLQIAISIFLLWRVLGPACFGGLAVMVVLSPAQVGLGKILAKNQAKVMKRKDARQKIMNEVLQGIRVIKFFAWEISFSERISEVRGQELAQLRKSMNVRAVTSFVWMFVPVLVSLTSFAIFTAAGGVLTAEIAFSALALFNVMRFPLTMLPNVITSIVEANIALQRLNKFLLGKELDKTAVQRLPSSPSDDAVVVMKGGSFQWSPKTPALTDINMSIPKGSLTAIVGEVGSGKSSLLQALLGEMPKQAGEVILRGSVAYVPQQAWIQNATVKNNILFGKEMDDKKYQKAVEVCELTKDLAMLPAGDDTEIGEKGINLSGGQKQRVSLARSVYSDAEIYLLDDPLSAVDAHVGKALFRNAISRHLKSATRILVTHQLHFLPKVDWIVMLKNGTVAEQGCYADLMAAKKGFYKLIQKHLSEEQQNRRKSLDESRSEEEEKEKEVKKEEKKREEEKKPAAGKTLISTEERSIGGVQGHVYLDYIIAIGGFLVGFSLVFFYVASTTVGILGNYWLSYWSSVSKAAATDAAAAAAAAANATNSSFSPSPLATNSTPVSALSQVRLFDELGMGAYFYLMVYGLIGVAQAIFILASQLTLITAGLNAAKKLHRKMLDRILRAPTAFFDTTPVGRILNRFSKDQFTVDEQLPQVVGSAFNTSLGVLSVIIVIGVVTPAFLLVVIPLAFLYQFIQKLYLRSSREIQRLETISKSPIFGLFSETIGGMSTIRAYDRVESFANINHKFVQKNQGAYYIWAVANRWLGLRLEFVGACVIFAAAFFAVLARSYIDPGLVGLSLSYALQLTGVLNWLVRMSTEVETNLVSVERLVEYTSVGVESPPIVEPRPDDSWPPSGQIEFKDLEMRYRPGLPLILKGVTATIKPQEKVGVVGRTGAGKSSLMLALFRIVEASAGSVIVDGVDISKVGLDDLRSRLAIIPQDPTLFTGTVRSNLDPFSVYSDAELWRALEAVSLKDQVTAMENSLDAKVSEYGENLSVGTRQLMCLARAILRRSKILVMDEATASVDFETDALIQTTIRKEFQQVTVLTIAHRINTIMDSDRVMILDAGKIAEFDSPKVLMKKKDSMFFALAQEAGHGESKAAEEEKVAENKALEKKAKKEKKQRSDKNEKKETSDKKEKKEKSEKKVKKDNKNKKEGKKDVEDEVKKEEEEELKKDPSESDLKETREKKERPDKKENKDSQKKTTSEVTEKVASEEGSPKEEEKTDNKKREKKAERKKKEEEENEK